MILGKDVFQAENSWKASRDHIGGEDTNSACWPPDRGAPVSPSPSLGAAMEKERRATARLAVIRGLATV